MKETETFYRLKPDAILRAAERSGHAPTGQFMQLNSLENRVYSVTVEDGQSLVLKFYRPGRWSARQIREEHAFARELGEACLPVCAPETLPGGDSLGEEEAIFFAVWKRALGRIPDEFTEKMLFQAGRSIALLHQVGARRGAEARLSLDSGNFIREPLRFLMDGKFVAAQFADRYASAALAAADALDASLAACPRIRIHGDCHWGNLLYDGDSLRFLDFDDFVNGPPSQDIWMIAPAVDGPGMAQRDILIAGYRTVRPFEDSWLSAINPLRAARYVHYAAWVAKRWEDPAFKNAFPSFGSPEYWESETKDLEGILVECVERQALPRAMAEEMEDISKLTNKDYFFDME